MWAKSHYDSSTGSNSPWHPWRHAAPSGATGLAPGVIENRVWAHEEDHAWVSNSWPTMPRARSTLAQKKSSPGYKTHRWCNRSKHRPRLRSFGWWCDTWRHRWKCHWRMRNLTLVHPSRKQAIFFAFFPALPGEYETWSVNYWKFEWDWKLIRSRSFLEGRKNKTTKHKHTPTNKHQTTAPQPGKFAKLSETRWNKTRPSQPLIGSLPPCSNPPRHPLFRCPPYLRLHFCPQAGP